MSAEKTIKAKSRSETTYHVAGFFVVLLAVLFVASLAHAGAYPVVSGDSWMAPAGSQSYNSGHPSFSVSITGTVAAVDPAAATFSLNPAGTDKGILFKADDAIVTMCGRLEDLKHLKAGDEVTVWYYQTASGYSIAKQIDIPGMSAC
ncbi:MAG: hypothetical protein M1497_04845 [Nitrospirae bacterium]|nr:hypothetical protein [Nitrospirota bacterium]